MENRCSLSDSRKAHRATPQSLMLSAESMWGLQSFGTNKIMVSLRSVLIVSHPHTHTVILFYSNGTCD